MRIRVDTPDRLVITDRPVILAVMLSAVLLALIGFALAAAAGGAWVGAAILLLAAAVIGGIAAVFIRRSDLILDRLAGEGAARAVAVIERWLTDPATAP